MEFELKLTEFCSQKTESSESCYEMFTKEEAKVNWQEEEVNANDLELTYFQKIDMINVKGKVNCFPMEEGTKITISTNGFWKKLPDKRNKTAKDSKSFYFGKSEAGEQLFLVSKNFENFRDGMAKDAVLNLDNDIIFNL
jgi:hypothetical protein